MLLFFRFGFKLISDVYYLRENPTPKHLKINKNSP